MNHDQHDDGLVHSHGWAREASPLGASRAQVVAAAMNAHPQQQEYDDGLVHSHGWACSERGRMAG